MKTPKKPRGSDLPASVTLVVESAVLNLNPAPTPAAGDSKATATAKESVRKHSEEYREAILKRYDVPYGWNPGGMND